MEAFRNFVKQNTDNYKKFNNETDTVQQKICSIEEVYYEAITSGTEKSFPGKSFNEKVLKLMDAATKFAIYKTELYKDGIILTDFEKEFYKKFILLREYIEKKDLKYVMKQLEQFEKEYFVPIRAGWKAQSKKITRGWDIHKKLCEMFKPFEN